MEITGATGPYGMSVSESNRANVSSKSNPRAFYVSRDEGLAFNMVSIDTDAAAGDIIAYLKNDSSTKRLFIKQIHVQAANAALWKIWGVTGTAAGSNALTPANWNRSRSTPAEVVARGDGAITGLTTGELLDTLRHGAGGHEHSIIDNVMILGPTDAIAVEYDTGTTGAAEVTIQFHFEDIGREN